MVLDDMEPLFGYPISALQGSYDDSASPNSDIEDESNFNISDPDATLAGGQANEETSNGKQRKGRRPPSTAERRATHNAVERARRESLNGRFLELAQALPSMASVKRPSKSIIVAKSLEYVYAAEDRERVLREANAALRREVDDLRAQLGLAPAPATAPISATSNVMAAAKKRSSGSFSSLVSSGEDSGHGCSPKSTGSPFEAKLSPAMPMPSTMSSAATSYSSVFGHPLGRAASHENALTPTPENTASAINNNAMMNAVSAMPYAGLASSVPVMSPYMNVNYLMALTMQQQQQAQAQQQQQNALNLSMTWSGYNFMNGMNHPASTSMSDYPAIFA